MSMSSAWSATIFLSRVFSFSSSFSFFMSVAFMPPNWLRQRCQVDVVISRCRQTSSAVLPWASSLSPSSSLRMICSGVWCLRFMVRVLLCPLWALDSHHGWLSSQGPGHPLYGTLSAHWRKLLSSCDLVGLPYARRAEGSICCLSSPTVVADV